jgi:hypothetical protein
MAARTRFGAILEWLAAATVVAGALAAGSIVVREIRTVQAVMPVIAGAASADAEPPAAVPPGVVSVPLLVLPDGKNVRVGDSASDVTARIGREAQVGVDAVERVAARERITRFYNYIGAQFVLVFDALEAKAEPRVTAIYLQ